MSRSPCVYVCVCVGILTSSFDRGIRANGARGGEYPDPPALTAEDEYFRTATAERRTRGAARVAMVIVLVVLVVVADKNACVCVCVCVCWLMRRARERQRTSKMTFSQPQRRRCSKFLFSLFRLEVCALERIKQKRVEANWCFLMFQTSQQGPFGCLRNGCQGIR